MFIKALVFSVVTSLAAYALAPHNKDSEVLAPLLPANKGIKVIQDSYIVVYKEDHDMEITDQSVKNGVKQLYDFGGFKGYSGKFNTETLRKIRQNPAVKYVEPDGIISIIETVNPTTTPWNLVRISHRNRNDTSGGYIYDPKAGEGTTAYILDSGIDIDNPEFEGRASLGANFAQDGDNDTLGHGSHSAGVIGSKTYGVAKKAKLISVKVINGSGLGIIVDVVGAINWAANHAKKNNPGKSVASMPLVGGISRSIDDAVNKAVESGLHFAVPAGNHNSDACNYSPARAEKVICVGATDELDRKASFSNYGSCVDIFAPGMYITSTWSKNRTQTISGTSAASSQVAGLIAYFLSLEQRDPTSMRSFLKAIATKDAIPGYDFVYNNSGK
ncbi:uncharacterized protein VTP21DRAFT_7708 [Calcarisporiella thermophila]|uniref:uncharacterized protein n=1 Tax=Calcarisporiella thermophila TaxID=911321 RepID=UPI003743ACB5